MNKKKFINDFSKLGKQISSVPFQRKHQHLLEKAELENRWFTQQSIKFTLEELAQTLTTAKLENWLDNYNITYPTKPKTIGMVLAGNIPLVGFHDILCSLATGNIVLAKLSHKDQVLYKLIKELLVGIDKTYETQINFTTDQLKDIDAIIATGSNNSARYFEYYFGKYPNIIRKNRNSIAIINSEYSPEDYNDLGKDIFTYFGLGCRNVSFLFLPINFNFKKLQQGIENYNNILEHNKYANNYNYQKAILAMNQTPFYDNNFCLFTQNNSLSSPIGVIHFSYYHNISEIEHYVENHNSEIQCITSKTKYSFKTYSLGMAQKPALKDYADNIDTVEFLMNL